MLSHPLDERLAKSHLMIRVRFCETDLMGIVHHGNYLAYMEAGRVDWLRKRGATYAAWAHQGRHLAVVEADVRYRAPARFDDELDVETHLVEVRAASVRFAYRVTRGELLVAEGMTRLAGVGDTNKLRRLDEEMIAVLMTGERG